MSSYSSYSLFHQPLQTSSTTSSFQPMQQPQFTQHSSSFHQQPSHTMQQNRYAHATPMKTSEQLSSHPTPATGVAAAAAFALNMSSAPAPALAMSNSLNTMQSNSTPPVRRTQFPIDVELVSASHHSSSELSRLTMSVTSSGSSDLSRRVTLRLENPEDPTFLFQADIDSSNYARLSKPLHADVSFEQLSSELECFLAEVQSSVDKQQLGKNEFSTGCKFVMSHDANLSIDHDFMLYNRTMRGTITFWTLKFRAASDAELKNFMASAWSVEKAMRIDLDNQLRNTILQLQNMDQNHEIARQRLHQLTVDQESAMTAERLRAERELLEEQTRAQCELAQTQKNHQTDISKITTELTTKWTTLNSLHESLQKEYTSLESDRNLLSQRLAASQFESEAAQKEAASLRQEKENLRAELNQLKEHAAKQSHDFQLLQRRADQAESAASTNEQVLALVKEGSTKEQTTRQMLEEQVSQLKKDLSLSQDRYAQSVEEMNKGNEVLSKLQSKLLSTKEKLEKKRETVAELEKALEGKENDHRDQAHTISDLKRDIVALEGDKSRVEAELKNTQKQLKDCENELSTRVRMFEALSNEKNQQTIGTLNPNPNSTNLHNISSWNALSAPSSFQPSVTPFTSSLHTSLYQPSVLPTPLQNNSVVATPPASGTSVPFQHRAVPVNLDFDSPSPGAVSVKASNLSAIRYPEPSVASHPGISASARQYLAARAQTTTTNSFMLPTTRGVVTQNKENPTVSVVSNTASMHTEHLTIFSPVMKNTSNTPAVGTSSPVENNGKQQQTRMPLAQKNPNLTRGQVATQREQDAVLSNYAPGVGVH